ncbi:MAG: hypothetical protein M0D57_00860 [Sphingobacteriales bacterium JAD_PAG50586_3]|nr:MAG: hypothetical protein M0D57_00860 [Sphingobacteriales bacterium JAD_PAG50586_3]
MLRRIIQILLGVAIIAVGFFLYQSVQGPVKWQKEKEVRYTDIKARLIDIRTAQNSYKAANRHYARTFADLTLVPKSGQAKTGQRQNNIACRLAFWAGLPGVFYTICTPQRAG